MFTVDADVDEDDPALRGLMDEDVEADVAADDEGKGAGGGEPEPSDD